MKSSYNVSEAKEIFRFKNEETIRRYIRMGRRFNNDFEEIKAIADSKDEGYLALCTEENVLPYKITCESLILLLMRKLGINQIEAESILNSFDNEKSMGETVTESNEESNGLFSSALDSAAAIAGVAMMPLGILGSVLGGVLSSRSITDSMPIKIYEKEENKLVRNDNDTLYVKDIFQELSEINEQIDRHDEDIADIRNTMQKIAEEKAKFDECYNKEVESGKEMIREREESKKAYREKRIELQKEAEKVLNEMKK